MPSRHPSSSASAAPDWASLGKVQRLDRFVLGPEIGRGAMGRVVRAWDPMLRRVVAVKLLLHADPIEMARFLQEAQVQAGLDHPNICRIYEVGSSLTQPYIAMQLIDGHTLDHHAGRMSLEEVARVMADVASAIHVAHRKGLIHRDIKPGNILMEPTADGPHRPYIMDFGLAKRLGEVTDAGFSAAGDGTPAFMSPEQSRGEAIGPSSDIYSLGATLYASLCGEPPRDPGALPDPTRARDLRVLRMKRPELSEDLEAVLVKCLQPEPTARYATAAALEEDLRSWLAGKPVVAQGPGLRSRLRRSLRRQPALWATGALTLLILGGTLGWSLHQRGHSRQILDLTTRFLLEVSLQESMLGRERLLPIHDIRPAMERARSRVVVIQRDMERIGEPARGPGHYAIGRIHLDLGELDAAERHLEAAWKAGLTSADVAATLGTVKAQRYFEALDQVLLRQHDNLPDHLRSLREARLREIEQYLRQAPGQGLSLSGLGLAEAYLALARGEYASAAARCRQALGEAPWLYEAILLEARALELLEDTAGPGEPTLRRSQWEACLDRAAAVAPSDDRVHAAQIRRHVRLGRQALRSGADAQVHFQRARAAYERSLLVRPDSPHTLAAVLTLEALQFQARDARGEDLRAELQPLIEQHRSAVDREPGTPVASEVLALTTLLVRQLQAHGEDPRAWLEWAGRHLETRDVLGWIGNRIDLAHTQIDLGLDPGKTLETLFARFEAIKRTHPVDVTVFLELGRARMEEARWLRDLGRPEMEALQRASEALQAALTLQPTHAEARIFLARVEARQAEARALRREDGRPALAAARRLLERGGEGSLLAEAELRLAELRGQELLGSGSSPGRPQGLQVAEALLASRPWDLESRAVAAELVLLEARENLRRGSAPEPLLVKASVIADHGLRQNPQSVALWLVKVRVEAFRGLRRWPASPGTTELEGQRLAVQATQRAPGRPDVRWLRGLLAHLTTREGTGLQDMAAVEREAPLAIARLRTTLPPLPAGLGVPP